MKKLILFSVFCFTLVADISAQANAYYYGTIGSRKKAQLTQYPITSNESYMFPTWDAQDAVFGGDTTIITVSQYETYVKLDSINRTAKLFLTPTSDVLPGAKVYVVPISSNDTARTLYVRSGSSAIDTVTVNNNRQKRMYWYDGSTWYPSYK